MYYLFIYLFYLFWEYLFTFSLAFYRFVCSFPLGLSCGSSFLPAASYANTDQLKRVYGAFSMDDRELLRLDAQLGIDARRLRTDYTPNIQLSWPGRDPIVLQGEVGYRPGKKAEVNLRLRNVFAEPVRVEGEHVAKKDFSWVKKHYHCYSMISETPHKLS